MTRDGEADFPAARLPEAHALVHRGRQDAASIRTKSDASNPVLVAAEAAQLVSAVHVPQLDDLVAASRQEIAPIRTESDRAERGGMAFELDGLSTEVSHIPNLDQMI